jgi:hypothetical protein
MMTTQFAGRAVLSVGVALVFTSLAAAPSRAADGNEHPLRGDFPEAAAAAAQAPSGSEAVGILEVLPAKSRKSAAAGDWLRGDFPRAVAVQAEPQATTQAAVRVEEKPNAEAAEPRLRAAEPVALTAGLGPALTKTDFVCQLAHGEPSAPAILRVFHLAAE